MSPKGVHVVKNEPVERMNNEGPLDQMFDISIDDNHRDFVFLDNLTDENDLFKRCPVLGAIEGNRGPAGNAIDGVLTELPYVMRDIYVNPSGTQLVPYGKDGTADRFAVTDARWMDDPKELIWKSSLLAQLQARLNAITHFVSDPSIANFAGTLSREECDRLAMRARELAAELHDEALNEMGHEVADARTRFTDAVRNTRKRFMRYAVSREEAIAKGGLTEDEINELFEEVR